MNSETNWDVVTEGIASILWCSASVYARNDAAAFSEIYAQFVEQHADIQPMNRGTAVMAGYLMFVYPREKELRKLPLDTIRDNVLPKFNWKVSSTDNTWAFLRKLCNALAHGNWHFREMDIVFESARENWSASIRIDEFGHFVSAFWVAVLENRFSGGISGLTNQSSPTH